MQDAYVVGFFSFPPLPPSPPCLLFLPVYVSLWLVVVVKVIDGSDDADGGALPPDRKKKKKEEVKTSSYLSWLEWNAERSYFVSTETLSSVFFP